MYDDNNHTRPYGRHDGARQLRTWRERERECKFDYDNTNVWGNVCVVYGNEIFVWCVTVEYLYDVRQCNICIMHVQDNVGDHTWLYIYIYMAMYVYISSEKCRLSHLATLSLDIAHIATFRIM